MVEGLEIDDFFIYLKECHVEGRWKYPSLLVCCWS